MTEPARRVDIREATAADYPRFARLVREWWDEHPPHLERLWFRHFGPTTVVAMTPEGRPAAVAVAFLSPGAPTRGVLQLAAVAPAVRRAGVGRAIVADAEKRLAAAGATSVEAVVWPGNRAGIRFLEALGYRPVEESNGTRLYGVPAIADFDGEGEDRAMLVREFALG